MDGDAAPDGAGIVQPAVEQPALDAVMESTSLKRSAPDDDAVAAEPEAKQPRLEGAAAEGYASAEHSHLNLSPCSCVIRHPELLH